MIFDYILNNRFYAPDDSETHNYGEDQVGGGSFPLSPGLSQEEEPLNPYADITPKAPHNRLETFLNMIVGDIPMDGYVAVDPIKPISEMEYWLNDIAAAKGGNPWAPETDTSGGLEAKLVTAQFTATNIFPTYMIDLDLGIDELPYDINKMWFMVEGDNYHISQVTADQIDNKPMPLIAENTYGVHSPFTLLPEDSEKSTELSNLPGIFVVFINACLYQLAGETMHAQILFGLIEGDGEFDGDPNHLYANADSIRINVSFDHVEEGEKS